MSDPALTAIVCDREPGTLAVVLRLTAEAGFEVVGVPDKAADVVDLVTSAQPQLVVLDQDLPYITGLDALPRVTAAAPGVVVLLLTRDETLHDRAMAAGAFGVVYKTRLTELVGALNRAKEFIASADERDPGERRTGKDRRHHQDWNQVTSERRSGRDRRREGD